MKKTTFFLNEILETFPLGKIQGTFKKNNVSTTIRMILAFASTEKEEEASGCGLEGPSYGEEKSEETLERGARDEIAMKVNKP